MNLQEIDRVLGEYGSVVLSREEFAQAAAEIRRQALEEAASLSDKFADVAFAQGLKPGNSWQEMKSNGCRQCTDALHRLAQSAEQEKS